MVAGWGGGSGRVDNQPAALSELCPSLPVRIHLLGATGAPFLLEIDPLAPGDALVLMAQKIFPRLERGRGAIAEEQPLRRSARLMLRNSAARPADA